MARIKPEFQTRNGHDYREVSRQQYAAEIYHHIDRYGPQYGLSNTEITALKLTVWIESSGQYNARPPAKRYTKAQVDQSGNSQNFEYKPIKGSKDYVQVKWRLDEENQPYKDYVRNSSAYSAFQTIRSSRVELNNTMPELQNNFPFSHPENQALLGLGLLAHDQKTVAQSLRNLESAVTNPYEVMGAGFGYTRHFLGATRSAKTVNAFASDPNILLTDLLPNSVFRGNPHLTLPKSLDPEEPNMRSWTVGQFKQWVDYKYTRADIWDNAIASEMLNRPGMSREAIEAEFHAALEGDITQPVPIMMAENEHTHKPTSKRQPLEITVTREIAGAGAEHVLGYDSGTKQVDPTRLLFNDRPDLNANSNLVELKASLQEKAFEETAPKPTVWQRLTNLFSSEEKPNTQLAEPTVQIAEANVQLAEPMDQSDPNKAYAFKNVSQETAQQSLQRNRDNINAIAQSKPPKHRYYSYEELNGLSQIFTNVSFIDQKDGNTEIAITEFAQNDTQSRIEALHCALGLEGGVIATGLKNDSHITPGKDRHELVITFDKDFKPEECEIYNNAPTSHAQNSPEKGPERS